MSINSMLSDSSLSLNDSSVTLNPAQDSGNPSNGSVHPMTLDHLYSAFQDRVKSLVELDEITMEINRAKFIKQELDIVNPKRLSYNNLLMELPAVALVKKQLLKKDPTVVEKLILKEQLLRDMPIDSSFMMNENGDDNDKDSTEFTTSAGGRRLKKPVSYDELVLYDTSLKRNAEDDQDNTGLDSEPLKKKKLNNGRGGAKKPVVDEAKRGSRLRKKHEESEKVDAFEDDSKLLTFRVPIPLPPPKRLAKEQRAVDKQYENVHLSIWKDLSRKDGPRIYRLLQQSTQIRLLNLKKTAMLLARESKRWQLRTNKSQKDVQSKARRSMREMFNFWKKNEREERDLRKRAERDALDKSKKEEEEREAKRQSRKLNFLITQTELYSHFIGKKIKTDELEGSMGDKSLASAASTIHHDQDDIDMNHAKNDFGSIDFDLDDETLRKTAAANAQNAMLSAQQKAQQFNDQAKDTNLDDDDEMNFQNPTSLGDINIEQPKLLTCTLKEYQVKGLNWLANLYDQGINGILADEMGLGKTVQSISVLAYLAETHNIWGPFLVVTPASTLHNWQQEISKFVPDFKVLPYWGSAKDRKVLRKFWDRKKIVYDKSSPFHVVVTSYQLVVSDAQYFQRMRWQYMILDEAQAIKSSQSSRWKVLLSFQCRNRLLLTGTPIQNSMQELWALLHFIMPSLFDSHDEFSEWFSKDIESHAQSNTQLNEQQLKRLHVILKPFMLRRIKKNVQSELGDKIEIDIYCDLTNRQKKLYQMVKSQISLMDLMEKLRGDTIKKNNDEDENTESLLNLVMQFRKVCNHPDLFERADTKSAFAFNKFAETASFLREKNDVDLFYSSRNEIEYKIPRLIYDDIVLPNYENSITDRVHLTNNKLNIWSPAYIKDNEDGLFSWLKFVDQTANEVNKIARQNIIQNSIDLKNFQASYKGDLLDRFQVAYEDDEYVTPINKLFLINELSPINKVNTNMEGELKELYTVRDTAFTDMYLNVLESALYSPAMAPPIDLACPSQNFTIKLTASLFDESIRSALMPLSLNTEYELMTKHVPLEQFPKADMLPHALNSRVGFSTIHLPSMKRFVIESGKLNRLDSLLEELKKGDHKVLVYFQMTRMMDLMEEYLKYKQYKYIRLDGSSKLSDRRDLVHDWQTKPELFVFLLSTRAGGLGINLTAADTVVFYDSDWNPTIDSQAMDRAHRLGQTRQVTVYRLLVRGTIEERMRDRAKQKEHVQQVVMEGKATSVGDDKKTNAAIEKKKEVAMLLLDD